MVTKSNRKPAGFVAKQLPLQEPLVDFDTLLKAIWNYDKWDEVIEAQRIISSAQQEKLAPSANRCLRFAIRGSRFGV